MNHPSPEAEFAQCKTCMKPRLHVEAKHRQTPSKMASSFNRKIQVCTDILFIKCRERMRKVQNDTTIRTIRNKLIAKKEGNMKKAGGKKTMKLFGNFLGHWKNGIRKSRTPKNQQPRLRSNFYQQKRECDLHYAWHDLLVCSFHCLSMSVPIYFVCQNQGVYESAIYTV